MAQGYLQVDVVSDANSFPVQDADIVVTRTEEPDEIIEKTRTNSSKKKSKMGIHRHASVLLTEIFALF